MGEVLMELEGFVALAYEMEEIEGTRRKAKFQVVEAGVETTVWRCLTPISWSGINVVATHILYMDEAGASLAWERLGSRKELDDVAFVGLVLDGETANG
jgi:hypothetical protein